MIGRIWHGFTTIKDADRYEQMLRDGVLPRIGRVTGYLGAQFFRKNLDNEVEFITIGYFDRLDSIKNFAGEDYAKSYIPPEAGELLIRYDGKSEHYEMVGMIVSGDFMKLAAPN